MLPPQIVFGYHGCDETVARVALEGGRLRPSANAYDWLGHGIYFWEGSPARALRWARDMRGRGPSPIRRPAVIGAILDLGHCLSLTDPDSAELVTFAYRDHQEACREEGITPPRNAGHDLKARFLDCAVMNHLHQLREEQGLPPFDTVRGFFTEGEALYPDSGLRSLDHVQVCVRHPRCIIGFFRPTAVAF